MKGPCDPARLPESMVRIVSNPLSTRISPMVLAIGSAFFPPIKESRLSMMEVGQGGEIKVTPIGEDTSQSRFPVLSLPLNPDFLGTKPLSPGDLSTSTASLIPPCELARLTDTWIPWVPDATSERGARDSGRESGI